MMLLDGGGEAIGYTQSEALAVVEEMKGGLKSLKSAMEDGWDPMIQSFRASWVGEDEASFEKTFATELGKMYTNCDTVAGNAMQFIIAAANTWADWQTQVASNFEGGQQVQKLDDYAHQPDTLTINPGEQSFDQSTVRGLTDGGAESTMVNAIDEYVNSVQTAFDGVYSSINASSAFIGSQQSQAMNDFIQGLGESMKQVLKMVDSFKTETIPELVKAYAEQQSSIAEDAKTEGQNINESISGISGS